MRRLRYIDTVRYVPFSNRGDDGGTSLTDTDVAVPRWLAAATLVVGWILVAVAIAVLIETDLGVAPYDVLNVGLAAWIGVAPGTAMWLTGSAMVLVAWLLGRRPGITTPVGLVAIGHCVNVALAVLPDITTIWWRVVVVGPSVLVLYVGVCLTIVSGLGAGPTEVLMLAAQARGVPLRWARWGIECACAGVGFALGGPVGAVTAVLVVCSAPIIAGVLPAARTCTAAVARRVS